MPIWQNISNGRMYLFTEIAQQEPCSPIRPCRLMNFCLMAPLLQGRWGGLPCLKSASFGLPGHWGSENSFSNVWNVVPWNHLTQILYWKNNNNALCTQRHSRYKLALDKNVYSFDISGLHWFLNEKSFVKKNWRTCFVSVYQWIWPYATYVLTSLNFKNPWRDTADIL